jgi:hypothetical protein
MKTDADALGNAKKSPGAQIKKTGADTHGTAETETGRAKHENDSRRPQYRRKRVPTLKTLKGESTPSVPPKPSPGAQNMKTAADALGNAENKSGRANQENGSRHPRYRRNRDRARET